MTLRDRILAVYRGETPDVTPYMLDLSHWFYHRQRLPWDLSTAYTKPERALIDYHRAVGAGFYMPNLAAFVDVRYASDVQSRLIKSADGSLLTWELETPLGTIRRQRRWEEQTYAWAIVEWGVTTETDLRILAYALAHRIYEPRWDVYRAWADYVGDLGVVYALAGYSALGHLLHYWMGIERTIYAAMEWPTLFREVIDTVNANALACVDLLAQSPVEVVCMGDNFSSDIQPAYFFDEWSRPFYTEAIRRLHTAGKAVAVHIDGKLRGNLALFSEIGADCADAVTPTPMGDLDPEACRAEAGPNLILSGGVSPDLWLPDRPREEFEGAVRRWLALRRHSPRLIANAGDQVPPGAEEDRIRIMRDLVEEFGRS